MEELTVGEVAKRFGITIRTLHHYDHIGLLTPEQRNASGYRVYTSADLTRLSQIIVYRRLEMSLDEIASVLDEGDEISHLRRQRERVMSRLDELTELVGAIDQALENAMTNTPMTDDDMRELFGDSFDDYQAEAEQKWGETAEWKESQRRATSYGKDDWVRIKAEGQAVEKALADAFRAGLPADSEEAMNAAEQHRHHVNRWFYDCPPAFHRTLGDMYVSDPRYVATYDESFGLPGLARYCRDAIHANADRS
ncbi:MULTISPECIES: MerR family transcriptional regulator [Mycolicibacterium]|uniref:Predicted transcriptional regulator n=3 Tax=Mycolicibacterium gilvum TaxID=1804 RepID=E6TA66_MYCSR|nr:MULTISPECIES: MerR family transcriptional regulator [Mycolicibacterium]ADT97338.1 predicted transcriptional regulator [Mycolicibacterium gilvum Spyr1]MBV5245360.1 MerR family transcriptional regulator [Mycolicibacterium sp. PAM1]MCV7059057.1 MerR family transcriptional regulator [Mycolicibacterium gilvum]STZ41527.1 MerR family transcriptional regulator [Mycolicibacterium gilvum]